MTNYELEEADLIKVQIILSFILLFTTFISILLSYNFLLNFEDKEGFYNDEDSFNILIFNRTVMLIVSLIFTYTKIEDRFIDSGIFLSMAISAFISSFVLCKMIKKKGLIHGIVVNVISVLIIFIISCILNNNISITNTLGIYISICCLSGIVGGILGVNV